MAPNLERKKTDGVAEENSHGSPLACFIAGFLFMCVSVAIFSGESKNASPWLIDTFGLFFFVLSLSTTFYGFLFMKKRAFLRDRKYAHPKAYWLEDYDWNEKQIKTSNLKTSIYFIFFAVLIQFIFLPYYFQVQKMGWNVLLDIVFLLGSLFTLFCLWGFIRHLLLYLKYGEITLKFKEFPFYLGEELRCTLLSNRKIEAFGDINIRLRYIEVEEEHYRSSGKNKTRKVCYQCYEDVQLFGEAELSFQSKKEFDIIFPLPGETIYQTKLSQGNPRYWLLNIEAETAGIDFEAESLLPIYKERKLNFT
jgi:hypothetical protein